MNDEILNSIRLSRLSFAENFRVAYKVNCYQCRGGSLWRISFEKKLTVDLHVTIFLNQRTSYK